MTARPVPTALQVKKCEQSTPRGLGGGAGDAGLVRGEGAPGPRRRRLPAGAAEDDIWAIEMRQGDTISAIAKRYLKNPNDWLKLQQFNKVRLDRAMPVGTRVNVPADWMRQIGRAHV